MKSPATLHDRFVQGHPPGDLDSYEELDDPAFQQATYRPVRGGLYEVELFLEGVHCPACVWLVEKVPLIATGTAEARLDLARSVATVRWDPAATGLAAIARCLDSLGYPPHVFRGAELHQLRRREDRALLLRMGVAGAIGLNVMGVSFALYGGIVLRNGRDLVDVVPVDLPAGLRAVAPVQGRRLPGGDVVEVPAGDTVPADGAVVEGESEVDLAWLTGEARRTLGVIRRNLLFSLCSNLARVTLAMNGVINPLIAAAPPPLSSLTVVLSSYRSRTFTAS